MPVSGSSKNKGAGGGNGEERSWWAQAEGKGRFRCDFRKQEGQEMVSVRKGIPKSGLSYVEGAGEKEETEPKSRGR